MELKLSSGTGTHPSGRCKQTPGTDTPPSGKPSPGRPELGKLRFWGIRMRPSDTGTAADNRRPEPDMKLGKPGSWRYCMRQEVAKPQQLWIILRIFSYIFFPFVKIINYFLAVGFTYLSSRGFLKTIVFSGSGMAGLKSLAAASASSMTTRNPTL